MKGLLSLAQTSRKFATVALVLCIAVAANVILSNFYVRKDFTEEKLYTLSDGTRNILKGLQEPVIIKLFFTSSEPSVPAHYTTFARRIEDRLTEYRIAGKGNILIETYDPTPDSDAEDWARKYGLIGQTIGFMGGPSLYLGLVVAAGDKEVAMPFADPRDEARIEYEITRMITRVTTDKKPTIGVMSSLPVLGQQAPPYPMPNQPPPAPAWIAFRQLQERYNVVSLDNNTDEIPADITALIMLHPKSFSDQAVFAVDQYLLRGGHLLVLLDPLSRIEAGMQAGNPQMRFAEQSSDLPRLLKAWGVTYDKSKVVADRDSGSTLRAGNRIEESLVWLSIKPDSMNDQDPLTSGIESIMMPYAGSFTVTPSKDIQVTPLITTSQNACSVAAMTARLSSDGVRQEFKSDVARLNLAVRLHGTFKTAFPEGKPTTDPAADDSVPPQPDTSSPALTESTTKGTLILVGDTDFVYDEFSIRMVQSFFGRSPQLMNDNIPFFSATLEQLTGSTDLATIRTRGKTNRPFEVVDELRQDAAKQYMEEERLLQSKLEAAEKRFNDLQTQKDASQQFILSPEQKQEITNVEEQVRTAKKERKELRKKLTRSIDSLGVKLKGLNILLMPCLIACVGIGFGIYRKKRSRR